MTMKNTTFAIWEDPEDHIPDHDLDPIEDDFDQDSWDDYQQSKEDLAMDERD